MLCQNCGSIERYGLLYLYLIKETDFFTKDNVFVDVGPRKELINLLSSYKNINHISIDISSPIASVRGDIADLPFASTIADYLVCYHILEHVENDNLALSEIYRILKPKGTGFIQVPLDTNRKSTFEVQTKDATERLSLFGQPDHLRTYGNDFSDKLKSAGFIVNRVNYVAKFTEQEKKLYGLKDSYKLIFYNTSEDMFIIKKKK